MWWGSELGFWVWLIFAWALWLGMVALSRPLLRVLPRSARVHQARRSPRAQHALSWLTSLVGLWSSPGFVDT